MSKQSTNQDMGSGSIPGLMLNLAIPAVVAQLINMLYNIVDRIYIGHIPDAGTAALTGVGLFLPVLMMINAFAIQVFAGIFSSDAALVDYTKWAMRIYMAGIFSAGIQTSCQQTFMALGQAKISLLMACLRKLVLLIPLIFILPHIFADKVFGVFVAEPVSDIIAASVTGSMLFCRLNGILEKGASGNGNKSL